VQGVHSYWAPFHHELAEITLCPGYPGLHLALGLDMALSYAVAVGACSEAEAAALPERGWRAFEQIGAGQSAAILGERATLRSSPSWRRCSSRERPCCSIARSADPGRSEVLGCQDGVGLYLLPEAAYAAVLRHSRDSNDPFPVRQDRLRRDLVREGIAEPGGDHRTVPVRINGRLRRVLLLAGPRSRPCWAPRSL